MIREDQAFLRYVVCTLVTIKWRSIKIRQDMEYVEF